MWYALISGSEAEAIRDAIRSIVQRSLAFAADGSMNSGDLHQGLAGISLLLYEAADVLPDPDLLITADALLGQALDWAAKARSAALFHGSLGPAWVLAERCQRSGDRAVASLVPLLNLVAQGLEQRTGATHEVDLLRGTSGALRVGLIASALPEARRLVATCCADLARSAQWDDLGPTWLTPPWSSLFEAVPASSHAFLGMAHGSLGQLSGMARAVSLGIAPSGTEELIQGGLSRVLQSAGSWHGYPGIPRAIVDGRPSEDGAQLSWCHCGVGIAGGLRAIARDLVSPDLLGSATSLLRLATEIPEASMPTSPTLCHGRAGVAHILNRVGQETSNREMLESARRWFRLTLSATTASLASTSESPPLPGVPSMSREPTSWLDSPSLLVGLAGVGLCLLAAISEREPSWDGVIGLT